MANHCLTGTSKINSLKSGYQGKNSNFTYKSIRETVSIFENALV